MAVIEKIDMVHALTLVMPYGMFFKDYLSKAPIEELQKVYSAYMDHAMQYNILEDRTRDAENEAMILRRRLASYERTPKQQHATRGSENFSRGKRKDGSGH